MKSSSYILRNNVPSLTWSSSIARTSHAFLISSVEHEPAINHVCCSNTLSLHQFQDFENFFLSSSLERQSVVDLECTISNAGNKRCNEMLVPFLIMPDYSYRTYPQSCQLWAKLPFTFRRPWRQETAWIRVSRQISSSSFSLLSLGCLCLLQVQRLQVFTDGRLHSRHQVLLAQHLHVAKLTYWPLTIALVHYLTLQTPLPRTQIACKLWRGSLRELSHIEKSNTTLLPFIVELILLIVYCWEIAGSIIWMVHFNINWHISNLVFILCENHDLGMQDVREDSRGIWTGRKQEWQNADCRVVRVYFQMVTCGTHRSNDYNQQMWLAAVFLPSRKWRDTSALHRFSCVKVCNRSFKLCCCRWVDTLTVLNGTGTNASPLRGTDERHFSMA